MTYFETILNLETGQETIRQLTEEEIVLVKKRKAENQKHFDEIEKDQEAKATQKAALLAKLGITDDEAKLLLS